MVLKSKRTNKNFYKKGNRTLKVGGGWFKSQFRVPKFLQKKSKVPLKQKSPPLPHTPPTIHKYDELYTNRHENPYNRLEGFIPNNQTKPYNTFVRSKPNPAHTELGQLGQSSNTNNKHKRISNLASRNLPAIPDTPATPEPIYGIPESKYDTSKKDSTYDIVQFSTKNRNTSAI